MCDVTTSEERDKWDASRIIFHHPASGDAASNDEVVLRPAPRNA